MKKTEDLEEVLDNVNFKDAIVPIYQNATSRLEVRAKILKENLLRQIEYPVNWVKIINNMDDNNANLYINQVFQIKSIPHNTIKLIYN